MLTSIRCLIAVTEPPTQRVPIASDRTGPAGGGPRPSRADGPRTGPRYGAGAWGAASRSPRETSSSSARVTVTASPATASPEGPSGPRMPATRVVRPEAATTTASPTASRPPPACRRSAEVGRGTVDPLHRQSEGQGGRVAGHPRALSASTSVGPACQGVFGLAATTLSPSLAEERDRLDASRSRDRPRRPGRPQRCRRRYPAKIRRGPSCSRPGSPGDPEQRADQGVAARLRQEALRASTSRTARSAVEAPVAMLRVYCSCPGVSATMKAQRGVGEEAVGDVDGDALLRSASSPSTRSAKSMASSRGAVALRVAGERRQHVGVEELSLEQEAADEGRLPVIHRAAGDEADEPSGVRRPRRCCGGRHQK